MHKNQVQLNCQHYWITHRYMCVDEGIWPWKGWKKGVCVFILRKPHPNGVKIYILTNSSAYVYNFWIFCEQQPETWQIVLDFTDKLPGISYVHIMAGTLCANN